MLTRTFALIAITLLLAISTSPASAAPRRPMPRFIAGADISLLTGMERQGVVYKVDGKPVDLLQAMRAHGYNCARLRLWVNPTRQGVMVNDLPYTIALGKRVKRAGLLLMLDIHYSDTWADPQKQYKPAAWSTLPFAQLTRKVHDYTRGVIAAMRKAGAMPDIVETGNEITGGMLWPDGKNWGPGHDFKNLAALLKSARRGVDDGSGSAPRPLIMIHIDRGADWKGTKWFFDAMRAEGVDYDIIGESYYPQFHGPIPKLKKTLANAAARYYKPILVTETAYPFKDNGQGPNPAMTYPKTPAGQQQFMHDLVALVHRTPNGLGRGVLYWEPEWLPTKGLGGAWNTTALFDDAGNALPAFNVYSHR